MANYESTFICSPELPAEKLDELIEKAKKVVENSQGTIVTVQQLGKKKLSYPVAKFREGTYVYMELSGPGPLVGALETFYRVNDGIIRYLNVKVEKKKKLPKAETVKPNVEEVSQNEPDKSETTGTK